MIGRVRGWFGEVGLPTPYDAAEHRAQDITWEYLRDGYELQVNRWHKTSNVPMIAGLVDLARHWRPDLVIWEPVTYAGSVAAKACGAAHARVTIGADVYGIARDHYLRLTAQRASDRVDPLGEWLCGYARRYGFDFSEDMVTGQFTLDLLPPSLRIQAAQRYVPLRYTPYGGPAVVPTWLWDGPPRPRVALTLGLTVTEHGVGYPVDVQDVLDAMADLDIELVATIAESEQKKLDRIPHNARLVPYVPLHVLLPTCSAVIHVVGVGTLATAALYSVPQLAVPWDVDGPLLAGRLVTQGAGLAVPASKVTGQIVRDSVLRLLHEPGFRHRAAALREEMRALPSPNQLVPQLEELTAKYRTATR